MTIRCAVLGAIAGMLFATPCDGQHVDEASFVDLSGAWQFRTGDDLNWKLPSTSQGQWDLIDVPDSWESRGHPDLDGFAWYRRAFKLPQDFGEGATVVLHLGKIDDVDEVYLNGVFVGATGGMPPAYYSAYDAVREYTLPPGALDANGENIVAVRIFDNGGFGGIVDGRVGLSEIGDLEPDLVRLDGMWSFRTGDDPSWSQVDVGKEGWTSITVPGNWEPQGYRDYDGYAWYRKEFFLPARPEPTHFVLRLGKIDDLDVAYMNGVEVGRTGAMGRAGISDNDWLTDREYRVPATVLNFG
ncbi:MAG: beta galactosidase jelly roll domain-containing protein, partial [Rhodothermales bacterium]|nr:beta galactosidase jelly roll domain-containing protein [Rhodothermales bacterium]